MKDEKEQEPKADDLTETKDPKSIELSEEDLKRVSGGFFKIQDKW